MSNPGQMAFTLPTLFRNACGNELNDIRNELSAQSHGELGCEVVDWEM